MSDVRERDVLWCRAALTLEARENLKLLRAFNAMRPDREGASMKKPGIALLRNVRLFMRFERRDLWLGAYFDDGPELRRRLYVCLVPMLPIVIQWHAPCPVEREIIRLGGAPSDELSGGGR